MLSFLPLFLSSLFFFLLILLAMSLFLLLYTHVLSCLSPGNVAQISKLSRWAVIDMVRELSTEAARSGGGKPWFENDITHTYVNC